MAVQLVFDSGFVDDVTVVGVIGDAISNWSPRNLYTLTRVLPLRQRYLLLQMLAESVLDDVPDPPAAQNMDPEQVCTQARTFVLLSCLLL